MDEDDVFPVRVVGSDYEQLWSLGKGDNNIIKITLHRFNHSLTGRYDLSVSRAGIKLCRDVHLVKISRRLIRSYGIRQSELRIYYFIQV